MVKIILPAAVTQREATTIAKKQAALRDQLWPNAADQIWNRKSHKGFTTIPKTMPLIFMLMDSLSKAAPLSPTYFALWCSTWDNGFITLSKPKELAYASGFSSQRAEYTWAARMKRLQELGFIGIKPGRSGELGYAIIYNPHFALRRLNGLGAFKGALEGPYLALVDLALEVGAQDMTNAIPLPQIPVAPALACDEEGAA